MRRALSLLTVLWLLCASHVAAQNSGDREDAASDRTIVVTGKKEPPTRSEVYEQARELSRVERFQLYDEPLPRFQMPLCPGVFGVKEDAAELMVDRIRANAVKLDIRLADQKCLPNLIVDFVDDGRKFMSDIAQAHRKAFCIVPNEEQAEILQEEGPVHVWVHARKIDIRRTGRPARVFRCREDTPSRSGGPGNRLHGAPFTIDIFLAMVVFDREAVLGMTFEQLADYATMRGLSNTRPASGEEPLPTILGLFEEDGDRIEGLTAFDFGYLRALYEAEGTALAVNRFLAVRRRTREEEIKASASGEQANVP